MLAPEDYLKQFFHIITIAIIITISIAIYKEYKNNNNEE